MQMMFSSLQALPNKQPLFTLGTLCFYRVTKDSGALQEKQVPRETGWEQMRPHHGKATRFSELSVDFACLHDLCTLLSEDALFPLSLLPSRVLKVPEEFLDPLGRKETRYVLSCRCQIQFPRWLASSGTSGSNVEKRNVAISKTQCALCVSLGLARCRWSRRNTWNAGNKGSCVAESCVNAESFALHS